MNPGRMGLVLGAILTLMVVRVADRVPSCYVEFRADPVARCSPPLQQRLRSLDRPLFLTYWASDSAAVPSALRDLRAEVLRLLRSCRAAAPQRFDFQVLDPDTDPMAQRSAARRGASPFRVDRIVQDAPSQSTIWSSLELQWGEGAAQTLHTILPQHLPRLQELLCAWLDQVRSPAPRRIALAAPPRFTRLRQALSAHALVQDLDLRREGPGLDIDTLLCLDPPRLSRARRRELEDFLLRGGALILAGPAPSIEADGERLRRIESTAAFEELLAGWGLGLAPECVLDEPSLRIGAGGQAGPSFTLESLAPDQDFRSLGDLGGGSFLFRAPSPLRLDDQSLEGRGLEAEVLASSSDRSRRAPWDAEARSLQQLQSLGTPAPKQPLMVHVHSADRWRGSLLVLTSSTPFCDEAIDLPGTVHRAWLDELMAHLGRPERLARARTPLALAPALPAMELGARWGWRLAVVGGLPAAWLLALLLRRRRDLRRGLQRWLRRLPLSRRRSTAPGEGSSGRPVWRTAGLLALPLLLPWGLDASAPDLALRRGEVHCLASATRSRLQALQADGGVRCTWLRSPAGDLPPGLRAHQDQLRSLLRRMARHGGLELVERDASLASAEELARWDTLGAPRYELASNASEGDDLHRFRCSLVLQRDPPHEPTPVPTEASDAGPSTARAPEPLLSFGSEPDFETAEFRLALALSTLQRGRAPRIAFASDSPRTTPAEGYEHYQQKGRIPPKGSDVYSQARQCLVDAGYEVVHVNPRQPALPPDFDALVWMQPRRDVRPMLRLCLDALHQGARVMIASQHFVMQAHQYRGRGYELVYWPEPQSPDLDRFYFPRLGIRLVREILLDRSQHDQALVSRVHGREAQRQFEVQTSALPFHVRAESAGMDQDSAVCRNLGAQSFSSAAFLEWDPATLQRLGLRARPLIRSSASSWTQSWSAGYLEPEQWTPPSDPAATGARILTALFEGRFPAPDAPWELESSPSTTALEPAPADTPVGRLLWTTASTAFRDGMLRREGLRADRLLLQGVAELSLPEDLSQLAGRRRVAPSLGWRPAAERARWRASVIALPVPVYLLGALLWRLLRRRRGR